MGVAHIVLSASHCRFSRDVNRLERTTVIAEARSSTEIAAVRELPRIVAWIIFAGLPEFRLRTRIIQVGHARPEADFLRVNSPAGRSDSQIEPSAAREATFAQSGPRLVAGSQKHHRRIAQNGLLGYAA